MKLMADDADAGLYLGRPCYFLQELGPECSPSLWTSERYSEQIVSAMAEALESWLGKNRHVGSVTLIGYSGGGVLALLLGERVGKVRNVIALSAPIDHGKWAALHGYTPLSGSVNPAEIQVWRPDVGRTLIFGGKDSNVPPSVFMPIARKIPNSRVLVSQNDGHECCFSEQWSVEVKKLDVK